MSHLFRKLGVAVIGATLVSLLSLLPAAAWGGYGGGGYSSGKSYSSMGYGSMGSYGSNSYSNNYGSHSYGNNYGSNSYGNNYNSHSYGNNYGSYGSSYYPHMKVRTFTYWVHFGDTLTRIAVRFHTSVGAILAVNPGIHDPDLIFAGMKIWVPFGSVYGMAYGGNSYGMGNSYSSGSSYGGGSMYGSGY